MYYVFSKIYDSTSKIDIDQQSGYKLSGTLGKLFGSKFLFKIDIGTFFHWKSKYCIDNEMAAPHCAFCVVL